MNTHSLLDKLLGGTARVRMMRFFLQNSRAIATSTELQKTLHCSFSAVARESRFLQRMKFIRRAYRVDEVMRGKKIIKKKMKGFIFSEHFPLTGPIRNLLVASLPVPREAMAKYFKNHGALLVVLGGAFIDLASSAEAFSLSDFLDHEHALDVLVVSNKTRKSSIEPFIKKLEAEAGKELSWALLSKQEFEHRKALHDKFLRDLFDYPHEVLINKLGL